MNPQQGWYLSPNEPGVLRWWDGARWTDSTAPAGTSGTPTSQHFAQSPRLPKRTASRWIWGFVYPRPLLTDAVFWWSILIGTLTLIAFFVRNLDTLRGRWDGVGFLVDVVVALPLNFGVFVLPVAAVRYWISMARRPRQPVASHTATAAPTRSVWDPQVESVWVGTTEVVFQRTVTGRVTAAARRGSLDQKTLAHAKARLRVNQTERGERPWTLG